MEEEKILKAPYYIVQYKDDEGLTHLAMVDDNQYLQFLKDRFIVISVKYVLDNS